MGRKQHPPGKAGTWIDVKVIKGRPYWYERTRVYLGAGQSRIKSKYLGPAEANTGERSGRITRMGESRRSEPTLI